MSSANSLTWSSFGRQAGLVVIVILVLCFPVSAHYEGLIAPTPEESATIKRQRCDLNIPPDTKEESIFLN